MSPAFFCVFFLFADAAQASRWLAFSVPALLITNTASFQLSPLPLLTKSPQLSSFNLLSIHDHRIHTLASIPVARTKHSMRPTGSTPEFSRLQDTSVKKLVARSAGGDEQRSLTDLVGDDIVGRVVSARFGEADPIEEHLRTCNSGGEQLTLRSFRNNEIPEDLREQYFQLVKRNMQAMYEYSDWGWTDERKWKDVINPKTRFVIATRKRFFDQIEEVVGGVLYGFELHNSTDTVAQTEDAKEPKGVVFLYEFQVTEQFQGKGLGKHLMAVMESIAVRARLDRVMLCVFRFNKPALGFYLRGAGYQVDWDCPWNFSQNTTYWVAKNVGSDLQISNLLLAKGRASGQAPAPAQRTAALQAEGSGVGRKQGGGGQGEGSVLGAALLFAGTAVGAGMLALPAETASAGFWPSEASLVLCWAFTIVTSLVTLEATWATSAEGEQEAGVGFVTMAGRAFGPAGQALTAGLLWFLLTAIVVAYTSAGGDYVHALSVASGIPHVSSKLGSVLFMAGFAALAVAGTKCVDAVNRALVTGLTTTFAGLVACGTPLVQPQLLARADWGAVWPSGVLIGIISFGAQNVVPTLFSYLDRDALRTRRAVLLGATLPLAMYSVWDAVFFGVIPYTPGQAQSSDILQALGKAADSGVVGSLATAFGVSAIGSSMAGASASFVDFFADSLPSKQVAADGATATSSDTAARMESTELEPAAETRAGNERKVGEDARVRGSRRLVAAGAALGPPLAFALINEGAFLKALENAGAVGVTLYGLLPALMVLRIRADADAEERAREGGESVRREVEQMPGRLPGGEASLLAVALGSSVLIVPELLRVISAVLPR